MPNRSNSGRAALERSSSLPAAAAVAAGRQLHRAVTATLVCLLCYTLLEASLCIWWSLQLSTVGPCQRDNEVRARNEVLPAAGIAACCCQLAEVFSP